MIYSVNFLNNTIFTFAAEILEEEADEILEEENLRLDEEIRELQEPVKNKLCLYHQKKDTAYIPIRDLDSGNGNNNNVIIQGAMGNLFTDKDIYEIVKFEIENESISYEKVEKVDVSNKLFQIKLKDQEIQPLQFDTVSIDNKQITYSNKATPNIQLIFSFKDTKILERCEYKSKKTHQLVPFIKEGEESVTFFEEGENISDQYHFIKTQHNSEEAHLTFNENILKDPGKIKTLELEIKEYKEKSEQEGNLINIKLINKRNKIIAGNDVFNEFQINGENQFVYYDIQQNRYILSKKIEKNLNFRKIVFTNSNNAIGQEIEKEIKKTQTEIEDLNNRKKNMGIKWEQDIQAKRAYKEILQDLRQKNAYLGQLQSGDNMVIRYKLKKVSEISKIMGQFDFFEKLRIDGFFFDAFGQIPPLGDPKWYKKGNLYIVKTKYDDNSYIVFVFDNWDNVACRAIYLEEPNKPIIKMRLFRERGGNILLSYKKPETTKCLSIVLWQRQLLFLTQKIPNITYDFLSQEEQAEKEEIIKDLTNPPQINPQKKYNFLLRNRGLKKEFHLNNAIIETDSLSQKNVFYISFCIFITLIVVCKIIFTKKKNKKQEQNDISV